MEFQQRLFRHPSILMSIFENGMTVSNVRKNAQATYSHVFQTMKYLVKINILVIDINTVNEFRKKYMLTKKGKEIQNHLKSILFVFKRIR